jgi:hypothetical protein
MGWRDSSTRLESEVCEDDVGRVDVDVGRVVVDVGRVDADVDVDVGG